VVAYVHANSFITRAMRESIAYRVAKPRGIPPADSPNRPALEFLYNYAVWVRSTRPRAKRFTYDGVLYGYVWAGDRMCVLHIRSGRVLVGAPGVRNG
jgi:hypothetical protein